eukprot:3938735-Rhodomonas_salina.1
MKRPPEHGMQHSPVQAYATATGCAVLTQCMVLWAARCWRRLRYMKYTYCSACTDTGYGGTGS